MMRRIGLLVTLALVGLGVLVAPGLAIAQDYSRPGFYLGVGGSYQLYVLEKEIEEVTNSKVNVDDSFGLNARAGYRFLSWRAAEVEYEWVPGFDVKILDKKALELKSSLITGNIRFILPTGRFQPYFKVGAGGYFASLEGSLGQGLKADQDGFAGRAGLGLDIYFTEHVAAYLGVDGVFTTQDISNVSSLKTVSGLYYVSGQFGIQYRF